MIKQLSFLIVFVIGFLFSCHKKEEKASSSLSFEMKTFRLESKGGCKDDTSVCASYTVEYPVFTGLAANVTDSIMKHIEESVDTGNPEAEVISFDAVGKTFIADFESSKNEFPDETLGWYYNSTVQVNILSDTLISLSASSDYFTGGAHGGYGIYFINANPSTGQQLSLKDFLKPGFENELRELGEIEFRKSLEMDDSTSYSEIGFEFADDQFRLNDNYGFTDKGIQFVFNVYEIGPYVLGAQEILIPYEKIKRWLK